MDRKEFIKLCGFACLGASSLGVLLSGCASSKAITLPITGDAIRVPLVEFAIEKDGTTEYRDSLVIRNDRLQFPIYVYRFSADEFSALYLRCTHQGNELNAYGDKLVCSAHGSEFDNKGNVTNGPADAPLKTFQTSIESPYLILSLKA